MIDYQVFLTILAMASVTYLTRISGYLLLRKRALSPRFAKLLEAVPGCVLIAVIAPSFATTNPANLLALALTLLFASRFSLLTTVIFSILTTGLLRYVLSL